MSEKCSISRSTIDSYEGRSSLQYDPGVMEWNVILIDYVTQVNLVTSSTRSNEISKEMETER